MLIAKNSRGKIVNIKESVKGEYYSCPFCHEELTRNFGLERQYFSHPKGTGIDCELKTKEYLNEDINITESDLDILSNEYYNKKFDDIKIDFSDYMSEEGYYLTQEQKDIIFSNEDKIKVSALAGSAKTSTMYYYCKERQSKKILYLVYNKAMKDEAIKTFGKLKNVDILTIHGLAYRYVGAYYKDKLTFNYSPVDVIKDLDLDWYRDKEVAVNIYNLLKEYMLSDKSNIDDVEMFADKEFKFIRDEIFNQAKKLWNLKKIYKNDIKVEHDFYLKLFQLSRKDLSDKYDIIILDEAQDSNLLTIDIIQNSNIKGVVEVGDKYQMLYKWRNAVNVLELFKEAKEYKLTTSFRINQNLAELSNILIKDCVGDTINMKGFNDKVTIVDKLDTNKPYVCLSRTNSALFGEVIESIRNKHKLFFEGGYNSYKFNNIKDAYLFSKGLPVKNNILSKFDSYWNMKEYADESKDIELLSLIKMVDTYGDSIPEMIDNIKYNTVTYKNKADVIFSTIHRSKGQTYKRVKILDDVLNINDYYNKRYVEHKTLESNEQEDVINESYIIYVAITRSSKEIELPDSFKKYLLTRYKYKIN